MEMVLNNGFCEMTEQESMITDGGVATIGCVATIAIVSVAVAVVVPIVYNDLKNCYNVGYNEVMSQNKK